MFKKEPRTSVNLARAPLARGNRLPEEPHMFTTAPTNTEKDHDADAAVGWSETRWIISDGRGRFQTLALEV